MMRTGAATFAAFFASLGVGGALVRWRNWLPLMDHPNVRSSHSKPKPRSGGIAIAAGLAAACVVLRPDIGALAVAGAGFFILGLADDLRPVPEAVRLVAQVFLAWLAVRGTGLEVGALGLPLGGGGALRGEGPAILWIVGFVNIFNFMDGLDGFALAKAVLGGLALFVLGRGAWLPVIAAAAGGLLVLNFPPARIFLGDGGSYLLGFALATACLVRRPDAPFVAFVLPFASFLVDETLTLSRRVCAGEKWYKAHRSHFYQRATNLGLSHRTIMTGDSALTLACSLAALGYLHWEAPPMRWAILFGVLATLAVPVLVISVSEGPRPREDEPRRTA